MPQKKNSGVPIYKKWWFWVLIAVWFIGSAIIGILFGERPESEEPPQQAEQSQEIPIVEKVSKYVEDNFIVVPDSVKVDGSNITISLWTKPGEIFAKKEQLQAICEPLANYVVENASDITNIHIGFFQKELKGHGRCVYEIRGDDLILDAEYWSDELE